MLERNWKHEYERALRQGRSVFPREEQRRHPRLTLAGASAAIRLAPHLSVIECDGERLVFHCEAPLPTGRRLRIHVSDEQALDVVVADCRREESGPAPLHERYRVTAQIGPSPH